MRSKGIQYVVKGTVRTNSYTSPQGKGVLTGCVFVWFFISCQSKKCNLVSCELRSYAANSQLVIYGQLLKVAVEGTEGVEIWLNRSTKPEMKVWVQY